eukprot:TRINITY_DN11319_c0_g1_i5.p2 TRINITY_DN11319_c0_g1~~TRINITY_DN11319_c0_g1_i5.p2  ORF type:complete len:110 (+),score=33.89 TRINITY_DN11319_c0_g1_i5:109-438(+)
MIRRPPRSTQGVSSAASDVYKRQEYMGLEQMEEKKEVSLEDEFQKTMKIMMDYLNKQSPDQVAHLGEIYELIENYQDDPATYMSKEIPLEYYIDTQKNRKLVPTSYEKS